MLLHFSYSQHCLEFLPCRKVSISLLLGWAKAQSLQAVWELLPKAAACPPQGGKGILALLPLADDDSSKKKINYFYLASKLLFLGDDCVFSPLYPVLQAASDRKTKNPTKNPTGFSEGFSY